MKNTTLSPAQKTMLEFADLHANDFSVCGAKIVTARILHTLGLIAFLEFSSGRPNIAIITKKGRIWSRRIGLKFLTYG